jgi:glycosyltransferase involved in cell wall biosynthesis
MPSPITVVIPTHNRRETVLLALASALAQTREPEQVLVVADGCTDGSVEAINALGDPRVAVLDLPKGPGRGYESRNQALQRAAGGVVAWLCDDDLYFPDHLERIGEIFDGGVADIVTVPACLVHEDDRFEMTWMDWGVDFYRERFEGNENRTPSSAVSHTGAAAIAVSGWRELPRAADMDLWQRMLRDGARPLALTSPTVLHFRASGRDQSYADRVRQNRAYAERLRDPHERAALRGAVERAMNSRIAEFEQWARAADHAARHAERELERLRAEG